MKALLLIAHGSRAASANDEIERLAERVAATAGSEFDAVVPAFLEMAEPNIHQGVARCVELGADEIVVVPYFLAAGRHVMRDIPGELDCARAGQPGIRIELASYVGASDAMPGLVVHSARGAEQA